MNLFPLTIFPEGGLASSIITTVWVGVFVLCFFNLRFGWVLSGLVVPGYLVPLIIVKPLAALVIVVEAILTYAIVWLFSEKLSRGRFPSLFGRDRFMGLILASIAVRLLLDGYLLPELAGWLETNFDRRIDWDDNLQSFGLVIISLLANQFWKPGLGRGLVMAAVTVGLTWFIIRFGLMEFTNFRISGVSYLYEGLASSILASPKAYIILTLTALIASHVNVRFGWDFSGILIPALIALQWYQPTKIVTSFAEAIIIYAAARLILKLPMMANVTLEGGRKLLLFFNISFAWKMLLGWFIVWQQIDVKTTDFFGFGYLLSTLIAIKAHDKNIFPRLARSTLQVSLAGAVLGNLAGFALSAANTRGYLGISHKSGSVQAAASSRFKGLLVAALGDAHVHAIRNDAAPLSDEGAQALSDLIELLEAGVPTGSGQVELKASGWHVMPVEGGRIALARADGSGRDLLVFDPAAQRKLAIIVPDPVAAPGLGVAALELLANQQASWLVIATAPSSAAINYRGVAEVFASASDSAQLVLATAPEGAGPSVDFANNAAAAVDIAALRRAIPELDVSLRVTAANELGRDRGNLQLDAASLRRFANTLAPLAPGSGAQPCRLPRPDEPEAGWQRNEQLAYIRYEIAAPMIARLRQGEAPYLARAAAQIAGFDLSRCRLAGRTHWSLHSPNRDEGYVFIAEGEAPERSVLTYRDWSGTLAARIGAAVHGQWNSNALFVAPVDDSYLRPTFSTFDVVWQEWVRSQEGLENPMTFQLRKRPAMGLAFPRGVDVVVAPDRIGPKQDGTGQLVSSLRRAGLRTEVADHSRVFAGLEARPGMTVRYFNETSGRRYAFGWLMMDGEGAP
ncbi:poly-gamma-glutamate biosynthesis protein PgsC/CapC [Altererythrobacter sp.]|uniref:poly-gamma-glutamate biosynthesis protein PgsC/CapC n=1 Tax=Altererythrobacter sp. TaxID=1872480 RepID=UPI003D0CC609